MARNSLRVCAAKRASDCLSRVTFASSSSASGISKSRRAEGWRLFCLSLEKWRTLPTRDVREYVHVLGSLHVFYKRTRSYLVARARLRLLRAFLSLSQLAISLRLFSRLVRLARLQGRPSIDVFFFCVSKLQSSC